MIQKFIHACLKKKKIELSNENEVRKINSLIYGNANQIIYSSANFDEKTFLKRKDLIRESMAKESSVDVAGSGLNSIIAVHNNIVLTDMSFYFTKVDSKFDCICQDYRDNVQRKYDKKWKEKLYLKWHDPLLSKISSFSGISKKEIEEKNKAFYKAMLSYWGIEE